MAGYVYLCFDPTGFLVGFVVSEFIAWLSTFSGKEGLLMVKKVIREVIASAKRIKGRVIASWEAHLPSRDTLLMSPCKSGEKKSGTLRASTASNGIKSQIQAGPLPNWSVKRTPTRPMASPFSWALLVPSTRCAPSGAAYLGR